MNEMAITDAYGNVILGLLTVSFCGKVYMNRTSECGDELYYPEASMNTLISRPRVYNTSECSWKCWVGLCWLHRSSKRIHPQ